MFLTCRVTLFKGLIQSCAGDWLLQVPLQLLHIDYVSGSVQLLYTPHIYQNLEEVTVMTHSLSGMVMWTGEQISDFVRKLGFLDAEGDTEWRISQFLHLNQVSTGHGSGWVGHVTCVAQAVPAPQPGEHWAWERLGGWVT